VRIYCRRHGVVKRKVAAGELLNFRQLLADLIIGRALLVIHLDEFPTHHALWVNYERRWMRPSFAVRIKDTVTVNDLVVFVFEERKVKLAFETVLHHLRKLF